MECIYCGRVNDRIMEINHKDGRGNKKGESGYYLYRAIVLGKRPINDLELTCKVCNIIHYADMLAKKYPLIPVN